jgi:hypothetical protein
VLVDGGVQLGFLIAVDQFLFRLPDAYVPAEVDVDVRSRAARG